MISPLPTGQTARRFEFGAISASPMFCVRVEFDILQQLAILWHE
jgi:hypothetical protein